MAVRFLNDLAPFDLTVQRTRTGVSIERVDPLTTAAIRLDRGEVLALLAALTEWFPAPLANARE